MKTIPNTYRPTEAQTEPAPWEKLAQEIADASQAAMWMLTADDEENRRALCIMDGENVPMPDEPDQFALMLNSLVTLQKLLKSKETTAFIALLKAQIRKQG